MCYITAHKCNIKIHFLFILEKFYLELIRIVELIFLFILFIGCAFVTFGTRQCAQNAIKSMHHSQTMEVSLLQNTSFVAIILFVYTKKLENWWKLLFSLSLLLLPASVVCARLLGKVRSKQIFKKSFEEKKNSETTLYFWKSILSVLLTIWDWQLLYG